MNKASLNWLVRLDSPAEHSYKISGIEGHIPPYLRGTYYLIGPACFKVGELSYQHWLDGDGMATKLEFRDSGVLYRNRFVHTRKRAAETDAGRPLFRAFGSRFPDDQLRFGIGLENPANVNIVTWQGRLLACGEQGRPWELDPKTLATRGEFSFGGRLGPIAPFSAHPSIDQSNGELVNFGISFSARSPRLNLFRFDRAGSLVYRRSHPLDAPRSVHDFLLTPEFIVVHVSGYVLDIDALLRGNSTVLEALDWQPELGSYLLVFDRASGDQLARVEVGHDYCLHLTNAFRSGTLLTVESLEYPEPIYPHYQPLTRLYEHVRLGTPIRRSLSVEDWQVVDERSHHYRLAPDFPHIDPRRAGRENRLSWMLGISKADQASPSFFDQLVRLDWQSESVETSPVGENKILAGEPVVVPDPDRSEGGSIICQQIDTETNSSSFVIFDANDLSSGPCATLPLVEPIPPGFHASFAQ